MECVVEGGGGFKKFIIFMIVWNFLGGYLYFMYILFFMLKYKGFRSMRSFLWIGFFKKLK